MKPAGLTPGIVTSWHLLSTLRCRSSIEFPSPKPWKNCLHETLFVLPVWRLTVFSLTRCSIHNESPIKIHIVLFSHRRLGAESNRQQTHQRAISWINVPSRKKSIFWIKGSSHSVKGCSHDTIATTIFSSQEMCCTRFCLHGAIATMTLNAMQAISCDKQIAVIISQCKQPLRPNEKTTLFSMSSEHCQFAILW